MQCLLYFNLTYRFPHSITAFMSWQVAQNAGLAELVQLGTSSENNIIEGIRLGRKDRDDDTKRRQVVVSAGAHGREVRRALRLLAILLRSLTAFFSPAHRQFASGSQHLSLCT